MSTEPEKRSDEETRIEADLDVLVRCEPGTYDSDAAYERLQDTFGSLLAALAASRADTDRLRELLGIDTWPREMEPANVREIAADEVRRVVQAERDAARDETTVAMCLRDNAAAERDAARVEVSQLRAKIEAAREAFAALPDSRTRRSEYDALRAALAEPLGSTPRTGAGEMSGLEDAMACGPYRREQADSIADELRELWQRALEREGNLASAVADVVWKATQFGETKDGDTFAYIVPKGAMHRLVGVAQQNGAHVPVAFHAPSVAPLGSTEDPPATEEKP